MGKIVSITEHFQHFLADLKESFWGDLEKKTQLAWKRFLEEEAERLGDQYAVLDSYERGSRQPTQYRNGYYERDFVTRFGTIRLRVARARGKSFLPRAMSPAMHLHAQPLSDTENYAEARRLQKQIQKVTEQPARNLGVRQMQDLFRDNAERLYHWVEDRRVPADNNVSTAARGSGDIVVDLQPTVLAVAQQRRPVP
jgi:hypothetical protein